jgi:PPM family protein phosphatase
LDRGFFVPGALMRGVQIDQSSVREAEGGTQAEPVVTRVVRNWGTARFLCSDGLTKHVSDEQIRQRLASMTSSRRVVEQLLNDALEAWGTDNITLIVSRTVRPAGQG